MKSCIEEAVMQVVFQNIIKLEKWTPRPYGSHRTTQ